MKKEFLDRSAGIISSIFHPLIIPLPLMLFYLRFAGLGWLQSLSWTLLSLGITTAPIASYLYLKPGYSLKDVPEAGERNILYMIGVIEILVLSGLMFLLEAPGLLFRLVAAVLLSAILGGLMNRFTKVSIHTGTMAGFTAAYATESMAAAALLLTLTALTGWARVQLGKHTPLQVAIRSTVPPVVFLLVMTI